MSAADAAAPVAAPAKRGPNEFLKAIIGRPVQVKLNSGVVCKGSTMGYTRKLLAGRSPHFYRRASMLGRIYEHCNGTNRGIC